MQVCLTAGWELWCILYATERLVSVMGETGVISISLNILPGIPLAGEVCRFVQSTQEHLLTLQKNQATAAQSSTLSSLYSSSPDIFLQ